MKKRNHLTSRSNLALDGAVFLMAVFVFVMLAFFAYKVLADLKPDIYSDLAAYNESKEAYSEVETRFPSVFTGLIMFLIIGLWAFVIIAALVSDAHPTLFIFAFILMIFILIASAYLGNFYEEFFSDAEYTGLTANFSLVNYIMSNFLKINLVVTMTSLLIMFVRNR